MSILVVSSPQLFCLLSYRKIDATQIAEHPRSSEECSCGARVVLINYVRRGLLLVERRLLSDVAASLQLQPGRLMAVTHGRAICCWIWSEIDDKQIERLHLLYVGLTAAVDWRSLTREDLTVFVYFFSLSRRAFTIQVSIERLAGIVTPSQDTLASISIRRLPLALSNLRLPQPFSRYSLAGM